jgi:hypothetical protein
MNEKEKYLTEKMIREISRERRSNNFNSSEAD